MTADRLRVLIVANMYPSPSRPSYGVFVADQVTALRATGEVEVEVFHWDARRRPWRYALAALELALTRLDVDVVHAHYGLSGVVAALATPRRLPLVLTVHGRDCHHAVVKRLTALVARRAAAVVAVSDELARRCPFPVAAVIPPGVDLELFRPLPRPEALARLGLDVDAGRLVVFPADPQRPEKRFADARALVERLAAGSKVELRPVFGRPRAEMPLWLNAADAVVITSEREGYGLACAEALACDVPVLSTPVGIAPALLTGLDGCLCAPFEATHWAAFLEEVLADAEPRVAGRAVAETQGLPEAARRTLQLYRELRRV
jgi:teichuronic acid biosynthesis glycosyltransferase TuaC